MAAVPGRVEPFRQSAWDWRAAGNFIGGGSGAGLLLFAAVVPGPGYRIQTVLGMALIAAGLLSVWAEIGRPWRALNVFRHARTSWMTREAMLAPLVFLTGAAAAVHGGGWLAWGTALLAALYLYCQARMLNAGHGIPAWRQRWVIPLIFITALAEGAGGCAIVRSFADGRAMPPWLPWVLAGLAAGRLLVYTIYRTSLARTGAPRNALATLNDFARPLAMFEIAVVLAAVAGVAFGRVGGILAIAGLLAVIAGWLLKLTIVVHAAFNQGFALPRLPDRGSGSGGQAVRPGW
jgi:phenylacetyl-CoA:acceptor oxidoreductase subunit 2